MSTTATDTLQRRSTDANIISGGHLAAKALRNEGVDTIFTLCGGHIIDIYDGCLDEGIRIIDAPRAGRRARRRRLCPTDRRRWLRGDHRRSRLHQRHDRDRLRVARRDPDPAHRRPRRPHAAQDGLLQDLPHVDMMAPITKFAATVPATERVADMVSMAARECYNGAWGPSYLEIPRDVLDREIDISKAVIPAPGRYRASTRSIGDPADIEKLADLLVNAERPCILLGTQWNCRGHEEAIELVRQLNIPAYFNGSGRGLLPPGDPHHFNRTRRMAFDKADVIVIVGTPFDFRMGYGRRLGRDAAVVQIDQDYRTVGKNRHLVARPGRSSGRHPGRGRTGGLGPRGQPRQEPARLDGGAAGRGAEGDRQADALVPVRKHADPPLPGGVGDQRVPHRGHRLHRRRRATW